MKRIVQINVTAASGSHGMIAEEIGRLAIKEGWDSWIAYGRWAGNSQSKLIRIGSRKDVLLHGLRSRLSDSHGLGSTGATKRLVSQLSTLKPDLIHLHNIHGYYINYQLLFQSLKASNVPVVWTLHDCWPLTGHCSHYVVAKCDKWKSACYSCPEKRSYPASLFLDNSKRNYAQKKESFLGLDNLTIVPVSNWLASQVRDSFLKDYPVHTIRNGIDTEIFQPCARKQSKLILGVASTWQQRKGLNDFYALRNILPEDYRICLVGLSEKQIACLPDGITGINRTENREQLAELYSRASVFVNPTYEEALGLVNLEALACGTPVVTYDAGGAPETIDKKTGIVVPTGNIQALAESIKWIAMNVNCFPQADCRLRAVEHFDKNDCFRKYIDLYNKILSK